LHDSHELQRQIEAETALLEQHMRVAASATPAQVAEAVDRLARVEALLGQVAPDSALWASTSACVARCKAYFDSPRFDVETSTGFFADVHGRPGFAVRTQPQAGVQVWQLSGSLDIASAPRLQELWMAAIDNGEQCFVLDLADLEFVSSAGLRVLVAGAKRCQVAVCTPNAHVARILDVGGIGRVLPVRASLVDALAVVRAR
jgi:anti-anti-sigma factor